MEKIDEIIGDIWNTATLEQRIHIRALQRVIYASYCHQCKDELLKNETVFCGSCDGVQVNQ